MESIVLILAQMGVQVNKTFLNHLREHKHGFRVLDVSSLSNDESEKDEDTDDCPEEEDKDERGKKDTRKKREKDRAVNLTKYLQYVTASD